jgi:hypothetical protein
MHICQSGVWAKAQGNGGTGLKAVYAPHVGKTITCITAYGTAMATIGGDGTPYFRRSTCGDTGWLAGQLTLTLDGACMGTGILNVRLTTNGIEYSWIGPSICTAWPLS